MEGEKGAIARGASPVPSPDRLHEGLVKFSFKYLETAHRKFDLPDTQIKGEYLGALLDRLLQISRMRCDEFRQAGKALRSHHIDWNGTSEPEGFSHLSEQLQACQAWQFSLARSGLGRIHGFFLGECFFPVWVDHEHRLYAGR